MSADATSEPDSVDSRKRRAPSSGVGGHAASAEPSTEVAGGSAHLAGIFATLEDLVANVVEFLTPVLRDAEGAAVVIATNDHLARLDAALTDAGYDPGSVRCVLLDVDEVLESVRRDGVVDRDLFRTTVGGVLDGHLDAGRHVRVYGELAGRLWERGEVIAAMSIEAFVDELALDRPVVVLCPYPTELFGEQDAGAQALRKVCETHTAIIHGQPFRSDLHTEVAHLAEVLHHQTVARAIEHQATRRERDALQEAVQDAVDRDQFRYDFMAMVVHDIRTPATVISGLTEVLQQRMSKLDPAQAADFLATIMRNAERIERLVDDLLTAAKLESDGFRYELKPLDLRTVVDQVATEIRQTTGRAIDVSADPHMPKAFADTDRQMQVVQNLLSNATKFSPAGTPVTVMLEHRDNRLLVHVRDQGRGIDADELDEVFEPFARLESREADKVHGTGLGLYITKTLVEGQGGTLSIASSKGHGTTVTYTVPVAATADTP